MSSDAGAWPLPAVVHLTDLGPLGSPISESDGQAKGIYPLDTRPGWLVKLYKAPGGTADVARLDGLVALPSVVADEDRALIRASTSWPVARVTDVSDAALGCVMPVAPPKFRATLQVTPSTSMQKYLDVDWLAQPADTLARRGIKVPTVNERLTVCRNVVAVAACLEKHKVVYSDWSYSNAFWSPADLSVFIIDVDGCGIGPTPNIYQPNWEDPLTSRSTLADSSTDRYRVALLIARCLTGQRLLAGTLHALAGVSSQVANPGLEQILLDMMLAADRARRPTLDNLRAVTEGRNYVRWKLDRVPMPAVPVSVPRTATTTMPKPPKTTTPPVSPNVRLPTTNGTSASPDLSPKSIALILAVAAAILLAIIVPLVAGAH